jgi:hypothetical protein
MAQLSYGVKIFALTIPYRRAHGARLELVGLKMRWIIAAALSMATMGAKAAPAITDTTTCQQVMGYTLSERDIGALHMSMGKYAASLFSKYGVAVPVDPENFGLNMGMECLARPLPPDTTMLEVAGKVHKYMR